VGTAVKNLTVLNQKRIRVEELTACQTEEEEEEKEEEEEGEEEEEKWI